MTGFSTGSKAQKAANNPLLGAHTSAPISPRTVPTYEGGVGYEREPKEELFLLAVSAKVNDVTFYERADERLSRLQDLTRKVTAEDPQWVARFVPWLRDVAQVRTASIVVACEYAGSYKAPHSSKDGHNPAGARHVVSAACQRADEPAECLAYWKAAHPESKLPQAIKRGVADATNRLYRQWSTLKYDGQSRTFRMGDVVDIAHPKPPVPVQSALYRYLLDVRHSREDVKVVEGLVDRGLEEIASITSFSQVPEEARRQSLRMGLPKTMTWERLSGWLPGGMDKEAWESVIPNMGYMALLRNLRNFDQAGVSDEVAKTIIDKLTDPEQVERSRQFPIRFFSAWKNTTSTRWGDALEKALQLSLQNVPALPGRTVILVDVSSSMWPGWGAQAMRGVGNFEVASLFGTALAQRAESADLVAYSSSSAALPVNPEGALLRTMSRCWEWAGAQGGTNTHQAITKHFNEHDRLIVLTDEQAHYGYGTEATLERIPRAYTFNLAGYKQGHTRPRKGHFTFGGLTDACFTIIEMLEAYNDGRFDINVLEESKAALPSA